MTLVCHSSAGTGGNQGSSSCLGKPGQPYQPFCWCGKPSSCALLFRRKRPQGKQWWLLFTHPCYKIKKLLKSLWSSGLKAAPADRVDVKENLSSLGWGNISNTGEFHRETCPLSSQLMSNQLACPTLSQGSHPCLACWSRLQQLQEVRFFHE